jgi:pimeloyl-ACP methyl ester carboxylesterase
MPFSDVRDVCLFFTDEGEGEPVLFVHGFSCDSHDWSWQLPDFAASGYRVIAADLRGHGRSSVPADGFTPLDFADDLVTLLDRLKVGPVIAIGHSLGAAIVSTLAVEHPEKVKALVCIDPGYLLPETFRPMTDTVLQALSGGDPVATAQGFLGASYSPASPPFLRTWHMRRIAGVPHHVLHGALAGLFDGPEAIGFDTVSIPYLSQRTCPVLAFYVDPTRAAVEAGLMADDRSKVVTCEGSGHWLHQERPGEVNHVITDWLTSLQG